MGKLTMELYLSSLSKRYKTANKREKGVILDELCAASGFHKKHAVRLLNARKKTRQRPINRGRPALYPAKLYLEPLKRVWLLSDQLCGKRLKMALPLWLPYYNNCHFQKTLSIAGQSWHGIRFIEKDCWGFKSSSIDGKLP